LDHHLPAIKSGSVLLKYAQHHLLLQINPQQHGKNMCFPERRNADYRIRRQICAKIIARPQKTAKQGETSSCYQIWVGRLFRDRCGFDSTAVNQLYIKVVMGLVLLIDRHGEVGSSPTLAICLVTYSNLLFWALASRGWCRSLPAEGRDLLMYNSYIIRHCEERSDVTIYFVK